MQGLPDCEKETGFAGDLQKPQAQAKAGVNKAAPA